VILERLLRSLIRAVILEAANDTDESTVPVSIVSRLDPSRSSPGAFGGTFGPQSANQWILNLGERAIDLNALVRSIEEDGLMERFNVKSETDQEGEEKYILNYSVPEIQRVLQEKLRREIAKLAPSNSKFSVKSGIPPAEETRILTSDDLARQIFAGMQGKSQESITAKVELVTKEYGNTEEVEYPIQAMIVDDRAWTSPRQSGDQTLTLHHRALTCQFMFRNPDYRALIEQQVEGTLIFYKIKSLQGRGRTFKTTPVSPTMDLEPDTVYMQLRSKEQKPEEAREFMLYITSLNLDSLEREVQDIQRILKTTLDATMDFNYTTQTLASVIRFIGISLPTLSAREMIRPVAAEWVDVGDIIANLIYDRAPSDIVLPNFPYVSDKYFLDENLSDIVTDAIQHILRRFSDKISVDVMRETNTLHQTIMDAFKAGVEQRDAMIKRLDAKLKKARGH
jgi:hypothetical protein